MIASTPEFLASPAHPLEARIVLAEALALRQKKQHTFHQQPRQTRCEFVRCQNRGTHLGKQARLPKEEVSSWSLTLHQFELPTP